MDKSLESTLEKTETAEERCRILVDYIEKNHRKLPVYVIHYLDLLLNEIDEVDDKGLKSEAYILLGRTQWFQSDFEGAINSFNTALDFAIQGDDTYLNTQALIGLGNVCLDYDRHDDALKYYFEGLKLAEKIDNTECLVSIYNNLGEIYKIYKSFDQALEHYEMADHCIDESIHVQRSHLVGIVWQNIGEVNCQLGNYEAARTKLLASMELFKKDGYLLSLASDYSILGELEYKDNNIDQSLAYYKLSQDLYEDMHDWVNYVTMLLTYSQVLSECGEKQQAEQKLKLALKYAKELDQGRLISQVLSVLARFYESEESYETALQLYKDYHDIDKKLSAKKMEERLESVKARVESEEISRRSVHYQTASAVYKERSEELGRAYEHISLISNIGKRLTSTLEFKQLYVYIYDSLSRMMAIDTFMLSIYDQARKHLKVEFLMEENVEIAISSVDVNNTGSLMAWCFRNNKEIFSGNIIDEFDDYIEEKSNLAGTLLTQSVMYIPIQYQFAVLGVLSIQSKKENAFDSHQLDFLKALSAYIAIAINNATKSTELIREIESRKAAQVQLEFLNQHLRSLSERDGLTGVFNRHRLEEYLGSLETENHKEIYIYMVDIDFFKNYNDYYGHLKGDEILKEVAQTLESEFEKHEGFFARYGGEEFVGILTGIEEDVAVALADDFMNCVRQLKIPHLESPLELITISIGCSSNKKVRNLDEALNYADRALYLSKRTGRNKASIHY